MAGMSSVKDQTEKERLSLRSDRRSTYGEDGKASHNSIPRGKQHRQTRHAVVTVFLCIAGLAHGQQPTVARASGDRSDLAFFEQKARLSKELGATDMLVTDGLPSADWEKDASDPYPMWFVHHAGLLTIFPPKELQPFVDAEYSAHVTSLLRGRCEILSRYGLKGVWNANEPAVLPEGFFAAHPELRGPRIDQPNRSRKVYFAPNVDQPETLRMYREATQALLGVCPEIEQFNWVTTDAGSGFDWTPSLYPGMNGNSNFRNRPIADRVSGFLINAQQAARDSGHEIQINLTPISPRPWMIPTFSPDVLENTVRKLPRGLAVQGKEGPDGRSFAGVRAIGSSGAFYPIAGIVVPAIDGSPGWRAASRFYVNFGDATTIDFNFRYLKFTRTLPMRTLAERVTALRAFAVSEVGEAQADNLVEVWNELDEVQNNLQVLDFGGMLRFGHVLNRWLTRPMVPFPEELSDQDARYYRPFLFQAKGPEQAADLVDIQAMRMYEGWGARLLFQRDIEISVPRVRNAISLVNAIRDSTKTEAAHGQWDVTGKRLQALLYLLQSAGNMVEYQAQLDRVKAIGAKPEANPVLGVQSDWARTDLMDLARNEIDTMVNLDKLIETTKEPLLDLASTPEEESIMRLGPDTSAAIRQKIQIMSRHWRDYDRLFTSPNP